jgi:hypothetical protein
MFLALRRNRKRAFGEHSASCSRVTGKPEVATIPIVNFRIADNTPEIVFAALKTDRGGLIPPSTFVRNSFHVLCKTLHFTRDEPHATVWFGANLKLPTDRREHR